MLLVYLGLVSITRETCQVLHVPPPDKKLQYISIVPSSVDTKPLRHGGEVLKQIVIRAIVHQMSRHGYLFPHHVSKAYDSGVGIDLEKLLYDLGVSSLMTLLISSDGAADLR